MKSKLEGTSNRLGINGERSQESYCEVDLELCRPHPAVLGMRFEYECEALVKNMSENGQLEPCRAVRNGENLLQILVYVGQRRLEAAKKLKSIVGIPTKLKVIIDEYGLTDDEIVKRALAENVDERGERLSLSDLEKISYTRDILKSYDEQKTEKLLVGAGFERYSAKKIVSLVDKLDNEKITKLHKIESKSNFRFKFAHIDLLLDSEDLKSFYETAAVAAFSQKPPEEIKHLRFCSGYFSKDIPWFHEIFPEYVSHGAGAGLEGDERNLPDNFTSRESKGSSDEPLEQEFMQTALESVIIARCIHCDSPILFKLKTGSPEFVFCDLKQNGSIEKLTLASNAVFDCERECPGCNKRFWITTSLLEGGRVVVETSKSKIETVPKDEAILRKVYWGQVEGWMTYDEASKKKIKLGDSKMSPSGEIKQQ